MTDLGNWLDEVYRISRPIREDDLDDPSLRAVIEAADQDAPQDD